MSDADSETAGALKELHAGPDATGKRLDQWLAAELSDDFSRSRVQALIRAGAVMVDGKAATGPNLRLSAGQSVAVAVPVAEPAAPQAEAIPLDVLYEDSSLIVVNKPAGLVVHPGAGNRNGTLVNALIHHCGDSLSGIGGVKRPGIVHRLDKDTSGVMVAAKTDAAHRSLSAAFAAHDEEDGIERAYLALVWGAPARDAGMVDAPLGRAADRVRRAVVSQSRADARHAVTRWKVLERYGGQGAAAVAALVECRLETGRTHQIRVHMAHIGHPVIGDPDYGRGFRSKAAKLPEPLRGQVEAFLRQALHARLLGFRHPATGDKMCFEAALPGDMAELVARFRDL